jgi:molybdopterin synthase catalytic subunit
MASALSELKPDETPGIVLFATVSDEPIEADHAATAVAHLTAGAVVTFAGVVRNHDDDRGVTWLHYSGHPSAGEVLADVAREIAAAHPGTRIAAAHRVGELQIGDVALSCAVASAHRAEAFAACAALVDEIKARVPIWKEQGFTDGSTEWVAALG